MNDPANAFYPNSGTDEVWIAFDFHGPVARSRFHQEHWIWGAATILDSSGYGHVTLALRPGGARRINV